MTLSAIPNSTVGQGQSSATANQLGQDYQSFLKLLVAQVQNQDPLSPMESTEFVSQLAQLTQVEQSVLSNSHMEKLRLQLALNAALSETALIGRQVTVPSDKMQVDETGGQFWYQLESEAQIVQAQIRDAKGNLIKTIDGLSGKPGELIEVTWDGIGDDGQPVTPGSYAMSISALGAEGVQGKYNSFTSGRVVAIDYSSGSTYLQLADGRRVGSGDIVRAE